MRRTLQQALWASYDMSGLFPTFEDLGFPSWGLDCLSQVIKGVSHINSPLGHWLSCLPLQLTFIPRHDFP
jgi:hypothetical protein